MPEQQDLKLLVPEGEYEAKFIGYNDPKELVSKPWMFRLPLRLQVQGQLLIHHYFGNLETVLMLQRLEKHHPKTLKVKVEHRDYNTYIFQEVRVSTKKEPVDGKSHKDT